jgi:4a-hydroxytetrahydrobiopterin dehydratase
MTQQLYREKCTACRRDSPHVTDEEIEEFRPQIPDWQLTNEGGIPKLDRAFRFPNFEQALAFTNAIGQMAEAEGHHPRLTTEWGRVGVTWWTHKIRNLHRNDFIMAAKTDQLYQESAPAEK